MFQYKKHQVLIKQHTTQGGLFSRNWFYRSSERQSGKKGIRLSARHRYPEVNVYRHISKFLVLRLRVHVEGEDSQSI